jgi:hypothetical protein
MTCASVPKGDSLRRLTHRVRVTSGLRAGFDQRHDDKARLLWAKLLEEALHHFLAATFGGPDQPTSDVIGEPRLDLEVKPLEIGGFEHELRPRPHLSRRWPPGPLERLLDQRMRRSSSSAT